MVYLKELFLKIAGIVLAGGLSSRMGEDKAKLVLAEQSLLARNVSLLTSLNLADVYVSGEYEDFQCIEDINQLLGPIGGIHACVSSLIYQYDALFIIPVDMPLLESDECQFLLSTFNQFKEGVYYQQAIFPMILPLTVELYQYLTEALASTHNKQRSLYRLIKTLKLQPIEYQAEKSYRFQNSNTPKEWADCLEMYHLKKDV
jgi:molybdopterin-guanine dinucleotide biosynthesis protein A